MIEGTLLVTPEALQQKSQTFRSMAVQVKALHDDVYIDIGNLRDDQHNHANAGQLATFTMTQAEVLADASNKDAVVLSEAQGYTDAAVASFVEITAADINALFAAE